MEFLGREILNRLKYARTQWSLFPLYLINQIRARARARAPANESSGKYFMRTSIRRTTLGLLLQAWRGAAASGGVREASSAPAARAIPKRRFQLAIARRTLI